MSQVFFSALQINTESAHIQNQLIHTVLYLAISQKIADLFRLYSNNYLYYHNKILITTGEFNGLSSALYRNGILHSEREILAKI